MIEITKTKWYDIFDNAVKPYSEKEVAEHIAKLFKKENIVADIKITNSKVEQKKYVRAIKKNNNRSMVSFTLKG